MSPEDYKAKRLELGLSQTALAKRLEVSRETVNKRESGKNRITEEAALAIKSLLQSNSRADSGRGTKGLNLAHGSALRI